eukprot:4436937-Pyramimonas_sp.AAC.1
MTAILGSPSGTHPPCVSPISLWGHEACEGCAGGACGQQRYGLRWSSLWGHEACERCAELGRGTHADGSTLAFGGAPYGGTKRARGVPNWVWGTHAGGNALAFGGAPYVATKRVRGVPNCVRGTHADGSTRAFGGAPLWGHERCEGCAELGAGDACGRQHSGLRWSSLWGHEGTKGVRVVPNCVWGTHADGSTLAFGGVGAPYGGTKRVR